MQLVNNDVLPTLAAHAVKAPIHLKGESFPESESAGNRF
jgi:hypothetical protein